MDSIFGKKRSTQSSRSRSSAQSNTSPTDLVSNSVPYDRLAPAAKAPVAGPSRLPTANALSAVAAGRIISPPNTNPTLTDDGQEFNYAAFGKRREANHRARSSTGTEPDDRRDRVTSASSSLRYQPPSVTLGMNGDTLPEHVPLPPSASSFSHNRRGSDAGSMRSISTTTSSVRPAVQADFAPYHVHRPTGSTRQSHTSNYNSAYSASSYSVDFPASTSSASTSYPSFYPKPTDDFHFERPKSPTRINAMFEHLLRTRNIDPNAASPSKPAASSHKISSRSSSSSITPSRAAKDMQNIPLETKWTLIKNDAQNQWQEQRRKMVDSAPRAGGPSTAMSDRSSPEFFLKKFMDGTLSLEVLAGMNVSIRTQPLPWCRALLELQGHVVLGNCLASYTRRNNK
jgi:cytokinesis protein